MAITKRGGHFYAYFRPFKGKKVGLKLDVSTKTEAKQVEAALIRACRSGSYGGLDQVTREACKRMFENQNWELPPELQDSAKPQEQLTLWQACELFLKYPDIKGSASYWRHEYALVHLAERLGKEKPLKSIWVPDLRKYQIERQNEGAAPDTVNRELSTLSRLFQVMIELQLVAENPVRLVRRLSTKTAERQVYLSLKDVQNIVSQCPVWFGQIVWAAYYTGMRRGEILGLMRKQVNLSKRMIYLGPEDTKEGRWKRVPIHRDLIPVLEETLKVACLESDRVFLLRDSSGIRPPTVEAVKNCWPRACKALGLEQPWPRFHDLRHTWRTNARRSRMDAQIAESILGHWFKGKSVNDRYGRISDAELVDAIDLMTFDHGDTEIIVSSRVGQALRKKR